jgi:hypothetical protein
MTQTSNGVMHQIVKTVISLVRMYVAEFQKEGTKTAELRQEVTTISSYPSKKVTSDLQDNLFNTSDFNFEAQVFNSKETRMAWIPVPEKATEEQVLELLAKVNAAGGTIYRVLSSAPILDENQKYAINQGIRTLDQFANAQVCKYPDNHDDENLRGKLLLDKAGRVMYRRTLFSKTPKEDVDNRGIVDTYMSPEIAMQLNGAAFVLESQEA